MGNETLDMTLTEYCVYTEKSLRKPLNEIGYMCLYFNLCCKDSLSSVIPKPESHLDPVNYSETSLSHRGDVISEQGSNNWAVTVQSFHIQR